MSEAGSESERSDTASGSDAPEDEGKLAWITRPRGFTKESVDDAALEAAAAVAAVDAAAATAAANKDADADAPEHAAGAGPSEKELERTVKRALRGLRSDFGQRRALDTLNGLLGAGAGAGAAAVRALPVLADSADVAAQLVHNVDVRLETLESLRLVAALAPAPRFAAHFLAAGGVPAVARAMTDADSVLGSDGLPVPGGPETLARLCTTILSALSSTDEGRTQILATLPPGALLDAMGLFSTCADVQVCCNNLLGAFALESAAHRRLVQARDGHLLTLRSMRDFSHDLRMQEIGCWCLRTLTANPALRKDLAVRAPPVLVAAMAQFPGEESLHVHCLDALAALFRGSSADSARFAEYRVPAAVAASMHAFRTSPAVLAHATALLRHATRNKKLRSAVAGDDALVGELFRALETHATHRAIAADCVAVFTALASTDCATLVQHLGADDARRVPTIVATAHPGDDELQTACRAYVRALQSSSSCTLL